MADDPDLRNRVNVVRSTIPAVTHVDYSARVQTVDEDRNPRFHRLLEAFDALTGCPVLVNTSFNVRGEPIVCTPEDAYRCFLATDMDALVLEDIVLLKDDVAREAGRGGARADTSRSSSSTRLTRRVVRCSGPTSIRCDRRPPKTLRQFAGLWLVVLRRLAGWRVVARACGHRTAVGLGRRWRGGRRWLGLVRPAASGRSTSAGWSRPSRSAGPSRSVMLARAVLRRLHAGGLVFRLIGRDALQLRRAAAVHPTGRHKTARRRRRPIISAVLRV